MQRARIYFFVLVVAGTALLAVSQVALSSVATVRADGRDPAITITLSPDSGPSGTLVQVNGFVPGAPDAAPGADVTSLHANVCWDSCPDGLTGNVGSVVWNSSTPGAFSLQFTVPQAPWLTVDGPRALLPGHYSVGVQCLTPPGSGLTPGCALQAAQATATFRLQPLASTRCDGDPCANLQISPAAGPAGTSIAIAGAAPLSTLGGGFALDYSVLLQRDALGSLAVSLNPLQLQQAADGTISGSARVPLAAPPLGTLEPGAYTASLQALLPVSRDRLTVATTPFVVTPAPAWSSLGVVNPLRIDRATAITGPALAGDAGNAARIAYCAPGSIRITEDGGASWSTLGTGGAEQAAAAAGYPLFTGGAAGPTCASLIFDPVQPGALYATFPAEKAGIGVPPIYFDGETSFDDGQSWQIVPAPDGYTLAQFGGFQTVDGAVQALFQQPAGWSKAPPEFLADQLGADGSWNPATFACPATGPCIRFGPAPTGIGSCAMNARVRSLLYSIDGGASFAAAAWPSYVDACGISQVAALSDTDAVLFTPRDPYPVRITRDGGRTWSAVALPPLPGSDATEPASFVALQLLPDGSLLASGDPGWLVLLPGGASWCSAALPTIALPDTVRPIGDQLWWLDSGASSSTPPAPASIPLGQMSNCMGAAATAGFSLEPWL